MALTVNPFGAVDQFIALREGLGTAPLGPPPMPPNVSPIAPGGTITTRRGMGAANPSPGGHPRWDEFRRMFPGLRQTSGYRTPEHNAAVGGVKGSKHTRPDNPAHDYVGSAAEMQRAAAWARSMGASEVLVHNAGSGMHLHVAW